MNNNAHSLLLPVYLNYPAISTRYTLRGEHSHCRHVVADQILARGRGELCKRSCAHAVPLGLEAAPFEVC